MAAVEIMDDDDFDDDDCEVFIHTPVKAQFRVMTTDVIKSISVKEVSNPQIFDSLGHPTVGGLHDPVFGPTEGDDVCQTCTLSAKHCPGHYGHIQLPVPVFHPFFFPYLHRTLKLTCFSCQRMLLPDAAAVIFMRQMQLLKDQDLPACAQLGELYCLVEDSDKTGGSSLTTLSTQAMRTKVDEVVEDVRSRGTPKEIPSRFEFSKNKEALSYEVLRALQKSFQKKKCPHCRAPVSKVVKDRQMRLYVTRGKRDAQGKRTRKAKPIAQPSNAREDEQMEDDVEVDDEKDDEKEENKQEAGCELLSPLRAREHMGKVWKNDGELLGWMYKGLRAFNSDIVPTDLFFIECVTVSPSRFRPVNFMNGNYIANPMTINLNDVLKAALDLRELAREMKAKKNQEQEPEDEKTDTPKRPVEDRIQDCCFRLQDAVNCHMDMDLSQKKEKLPGVRQLLEKKSGLIRQHMMGKRVNHAARTVISPDPLIRTNEIGIPEIFARKLVYPTTVTDWNFPKLRQAVINGPDNYPGATMVVDEDGSMVRLNPKDVTSRTAIANQLLTPNPNARKHSNSKPRPKQVMRHLVDGDWLLLNRQPSLHRPSIQAHNAKVLPGMKTLRLHYSNCKAYNADFDGDEMNAHFPQDETSRAEAAVLLSTDHQYIVPKDGMPLGGLIQDHIVGGLKLTMRGRFFTRMEYHNLLWEAMHDNPRDFKLLVPCILKPKALWSGKQVISTLLLNLIPRGKKPLNLKSKAKVGEKSWLNRNLCQDVEARLLQEEIERMDMGESTVVVRQGELVQGVLDKAQIGASPHGLIHCCYELYGGAVAGKLLTAIGRLCTAFLQIAGFTLSMQDIMINSKAEKRRRKQLKKIDKMGDAVVAEALGLPPDADHETIVQHYREAHFASSDVGLRQIDNAMRQKTSEAVSKIQKDCMEGLVTKFPENNLQMMIQSGAKGSVVNGLQISALIGQIELEGRRPGMNLGGRTLPMFEAYDTSPRAGGFVGQRYLTGLKEPESFFAHMAGREGLVDTAVKTSRSGYLQRCLVKHLEGLVAAYDGTVRDSDQSVIQFSYGEDGLDVTKTAFLDPRLLEFLHSNSLVLEVPALSPSPHEKAIRKLRKRIREAKKSGEKGDRYRAFLRFSEDYHVGKKELKATQADAAQCPGRSAKALAICRKWQAMEEEERESYRSRLDFCPEPVAAKFFPHCNLGVVSEKMDKEFSAFVKKLSEMPTPKDGVSPEEFRRILDYKFMSSLVEPGESVGLLCAQSLGEPSTQMTLNTFHFAGMSEMNVTMGIPRLREILMTAGTNLSTPSMAIPVLPGHEEEAGRLQKKLSRVYLHQVLHENVVTVTEDDFEGNSVTIKLTLLPHFVCKGRYGLSHRQILQFLEKSYVRHLTRVIKEQVDLCNKGPSISIFKQRMMAKKAAATDEDRDCEDLKRKKLDEVDYEGEDEEKVEARIDEDKEVEAEEESGEDDVSGDDEDADEEDLVSKAAAAERTENVMEIQGVLGYKFDRKKSKWMEVQLAVPRGVNIDFQKVLQEDAETTVIRSVKNLGRCFQEWRGPGSDKQLYLVTEGVNMIEMYKYNNILDVNKLYTNDIHTVSKVFGIEAARITIVKELHSVFDAYGIKVDYRHLSLLADYMTHEGRYRSLNRMAIESCTSPMQKMSFETATHFVKEAVMQGSDDLLTSPSARIMMGQPILCGTGSHDIRMKVDFGKKGSSLH